MCACRMIGKKTRQGTCAAVCVSVCVFLCIRVWATDTATLIFVCTFSEANWSGRVGCVFDCSELLYPVTVGAKLGWFAARTHGGEGHIMLTPVDADEPPVPQRVVKYRYDACIRCATFASSILRGVGCMPPPAAPTHAVVPGDQSTACASVSESCCFCASVDCERLPVLGWVGGWWVGVGD